MKTMIVLLGILSISFVVGPCLDHSLDPISKVSFILTGLFFGGAAIALAAPLIRKEIDEKIDRDINAAFANVEILQED